jgi:moderate conductance mechanosensitive channel
VEDLMRSFLVMLTLFFAPQANAEPSAAERAWTDALRATPSLVSLGQMEDLGKAGDRLVSVLKDRLKLLGAKTFSNREWKTYWQRQKSTAKALITAQPAAGRQQGLTEWADLAGAKSANQDTYLAAIETERDAVEERLEAALTEHREKSTAKPSPSQPGNRLQQRRNEIKELRQQRAQQIRKEGAANLELALIERLIASEKLLHMALAKDVELAELELAIATRQVGIADAAWSDLWAPIREATEGKLAKLVAEVEFSAQRGRSLELERGLAQSQIAHRARKQAELTASIKTANSFDGWLDAAYRTATDWITHKLWLVLLSLLGIYLGLKVALKMIDRSVRALAQTADDGDDDKLSQKEQRAQTLAAVAAGLLKFTAYAVACLTALEQIGVNTAPILGSVAILGLAISFGSQNLVRDVVNGFFILIENQFAVGDFIEIGGRGGTVEKINLRTTQIRQLDGTLHVVPNGSIDSVANQTRDWARTVVHIGVAYDADLATVEAVINGVGDELYADPEWSPSLEEAPRFIGVTELADSAVNLRCMALCEPGSQWGLGRELNRRLKLAFDARGIEIPFPQRVVWSRDA